MIRFTSLQYSLSVILLFSMHCQAGGFDSSGRPFDIIFGDKNELRFSIYRIEPDVKMSASRTLGEGGLIAPSEVVDVVRGYNEALLGVRLVYNKQVHCALQFEQPFRYYTHYADDSLSYVPDSNNLSEQVAAPLESEYRSFSTTFACQYAVLFNPADSFFGSSRLSITLGPKYQTIEGVFSSDLSSQNLGEYDNYRAELNGSNEWGYIVGLAYEIPDIAFRVSLFYHPETQHKLSGKASAPVPDFSSLMAQGVHGNTLTPRALNLNIQSGFAQDWLIFAEIRWGDWTALDEIDLEAGPLSQTIDLFSNDTINYKIGLGYRVNERFSIGGYFASLFKIGNEDLPPGVDGTDLRNPESDRYSIGLGGAYKLNQHLGLKLGGSYYYLKQGRFADPYFTVDLERSSAFGVSGTIQYYF
jgi:long-chain fatty acid transport protein